MNSSVKSFPAAVLPGYVMKLSFFSAIIVAVWLSHAPGCADMPEMNFLTCFGAMETGKEKVGLCLTYIILKMMPILHRL